MGVFLGPVGMALAGLGLGSLSAEMARCYLRRLTSTANLPTNQT